jgi:hypothetical protein
MYHIYLPNQYGMQAVLVVYPWLADAIFFGEVQRSSALDLLDFITWRFSLLSRATASTM